MPYQKESNPLDLWRHGLRGALFHIKEPTNGAYKGGDPLAPHYYYPRRKP